MDELTILKRIEAIVCAGEEIQVTRIHHIPRGKNYFSIPRMIIMSLARDVHKIPYACIGGFYNRDHATALNAQIKVKNWCDTDREFRAKYDNYIKLVSEDMPGLPDINVIYILQNGIKEGIERLKSEQSDLDSIIDRLIKRIPVEESVFGENDCYEKQ